MNRPNDAEVHPDFDRQLPAGKEWFSIRWLARHWGKSPRHISNLVESGEIKISVDLRGKFAKRSDTNIYRTAIIEFLERRKNNQFSSVTQQPRPKKPEAPTTKEHT